jgi:hypothetical protein
MSIDNYKKLQELTKENNQLVGVKLPVLSSGFLAITSEKLTLEQVSNKLHCFTDSDGWILFTDGIVISEKPDGTRHFIEGEWSNQQTTLKIKQLVGDCYLVTTVEQNNETGVLAAYVDRHFQLSTNCNEDKAQPNHVIYRLWYGQSAVKNEEERWVPLNQQFIGFAVN